MKNSNTFYYITLLLLLILLQNCTSEEHSEAEYYSIDDFNTIEKFNSHVHLRGDNTSYIEQAIRDNFKLLSLVSSSPGATRSMSVEEQEEEILQKMEVFPENLFYSTTILDPYSFNEPDWEEKTIEHLQRSFDRGTVAVKIRKSIGMEVQDPEGNFIRVDDPKFDSIMAFIEENDKTLIGHIGEPMNAWLPLEEMTTGGDRQYYSGMPQYHMYLHPDLPGHEVHIEARDNMLAKNPNLRFVGAHLGSLEYDVDELAKRLDRFPNMAVDMAERICHLQHQAVTDWQKVHDFFIKYQDRLIYATDESSFGPKPHYGAALTDQSLRTDEQIAEASRENWLRHWKFFVSDERMSAPKVEEEFNGLKLPREVIDKIYLTNAEKWFPGILQ
ncbi:MAG: amidohydrolase family protein [Balneolales bacterium]